MSKPGRSAAAAAVQAARLPEVEAQLLARAPESVIEPTLDRIRAVLDLMGDPQRSFPVIHVAGTNGKSSTARMADALLTAYDLRTGRYTSPHLESVQERIALDGAPVSAERFVAAFDEVAPFVELVEQDGGRRLTYFEVVTAMAYAVFADAPVAVACVEVGLGGTWDATNVMDAAVSVVTPIGLDHQQWLGDDLTSIAAEKAGIVGPGGFLVLAQQPVEAAEVVLRRAADVGATVAREGFEFGVLDRQVAVGGQLVTLRGLAGEYDEVFVPLHGAHQAHNAACALVAVEAFLGGGRAPLDVDAVRAGFAAVQSPGRLEVVRRSPTVLVDAAHNPEGARVLADAVVDAFAFGRLVGVVAVLDDKDAHGILAALEPVLAEVVVTRSASPRALEPDALAEIAVDVFGADRVVVEPELPAALDRAVTEAEFGGDLGSSGVLVTGSVTLAGEARLLLGGRSAGAGGDSAQRPTGGDPESGED